MGFAQGKYQVFKNRAADPVDGSNVIDWGGGRGSLVVAGGVVGNTVALSYSPDDGATWLPGSATLSVTAVGITNFDLPPGKLRVNTTGGTPTEMNIWIMATPF